MEIDKRTHLHRLVLVPEADWATLMNAKKARQSTAVDRILNTLPLLKKYRSEYFGIDQYHHALHDCDPCGKIRSN